MGISTAFVRVWCDDCQTEDEIELTPLAGKGNYDSRNVQRRLERDGWEIDGDRHVCESCVAVRDSVDE